MSTAADSIPRPANTTALTAGDVMGVADSVTPANAGSAVLAFRFPAGGRDGELILTGAVLAIALGSVPSGMTSFRLHLYSAAPDAILDNAAWGALASANDKAAYLGYIDLGSPVVVGGLLYARVDGLAMHVKSADGSPTLYGQLVTNGGYTPASGTVSTVTLTGIQVGP